MKKNILAIIQARSGSQRLPGKTLLCLEGKTVLEHVIDRVQESRLVSEVIVATTVSRRDLKIVRLCAEQGVRVYCGSEDDVLDRYYQAARVFGAGHVVRITADCPLMDPAVIDSVVRLHLKTRADYTSNVIKATFPDGEDVEVFTFPALQRAWLKAVLPSEREHVTPYITKHPASFKLRSFEMRYDLSAKRWTLDEKDDYRFIRLVYKHLYRKHKIFTMEQVLGLLEKHPEYEKINHAILRNEGYLRSLRLDKSLERRVSLKKG